MSKGSNAVIPAVIVAIELVSDLEKCQRSRWLCKEIESVTYGLGCCKDIQLTIKTVYTVHGYCDNC